MNVSDDSLETKLLQEMSKLRISYLKVKCDNKRKIKTQRVCKLKFSSKFGYCRVFNYIYIFHNTFHFGKCELRFNFMHFFTFTKNKTEMYVYQGTPAYVLLFFSINNL